MLFYRRLTPTERAKLASRKSKSDAATVESKNAPKSLSLEPSPLPQSRESKSFLLSPAVAEVVNRDNFAYLNEIISQTTPHYLQALNAVVRSQASYTGPFHVNLAQAQAASVPSAVAEATGCPTCLAPAKLHSANGADIGDKCPFIAYQVLECPKCLMPLSRAGFESHVKQCQHQELWSGFGPPRAPSAPVAPEPPTAPPPPSLDRAVRLFRGCRFYP
jgi:hypothetical protein